MRETAPALEVESIRKHYGPTVALAEASMNIAPGEIHAVLGENGAGKSTLVKILSGVVRPDQGTLRVNGREPPSFHSILDARRAGIATAFQELSLLPNLSVAENLLLPHLLRGPIGLTSRRANQQRATEILSRFGVDDLDPNAPVESLALAEKQRLEITRALWQARHLLVLDEPSASLSDTTWLFEQIRRLAGDGLAVLYISHRLSEVRSLCSRATVLRNGRSIDSVDLEGVDDDRIFEMMVGRSPEEAAGEVRRRAPVGEVVLETLGLTAGKVRKADSRLHSGEILGVAALEGQGQRDLFRALTGLAHLDSGEIRVQGEPASIHSPRKALRAGPGIAFVPEERKTEGIFSSLRTATNVILPQAFLLSRFGFLSHRIEQRHAKTTAQRLDLQTRYLGFRIDALSGGNQQKAVIARALGSGAGILVLFDPTRGVDVGTKQSIYRVIREFADAGGAVLLYSSEIPELIELCNRCLVLYDGQITDELSGDAITEQALISGIVGHRSPGQPTAAEAS